MKKGVAAALFVVVVMAVVVHETAAVVCDATRLVPCATSITTGIPYPPTADCCSKLKEQEPCFCSFIKNAAYKQYLESPNAPRVANACNVTIPTNCPSLK